MALACVYIIDLFPLCASGAHRSSRRFPLCCRPSASCRVVHSSVGDLSILRCSPFSFGLLGRLHLYVIPRAVLGSPSPKTYFHSGRPRQKLIGQEREAHRPERVSVRLAGRPVLLLLSKASGRGGSGGGTLLLGHSLLCKKSQKNKKTHTPICLYHQNGPSQSLSLCARHPTLSTPIRSRGWRSRWS